MDSEQGLRDKQVGPRNQNQSSEPSPALFSSLPTCSALLPVACDTPTFPLVNSRSSFCYVTSSENISLIPREICLSLYSN